VLSYSSLSLSLVIARYAYTGAIYYYALYLTDIGAR
jgi:hypothetical protein